MSSANPTKRLPGPRDTVTKAHIIGDPRRSRRGMAPVPAGQSLKEDGSPDYGIFGPSSLVWEVLLHPATIIFHNIAQVRGQEIYLPVAAAARDYEPLMKKAREGTVTFFNIYERLARGAAMHVPMWLGDTATAKHTAAWLHKVHSPLVGDVIDAEHPEIGGYSAGDPRDSMWAALTEMHPMLRAYEAFAFNGWRWPRRLPKEQRDQFIRESAAYLRLHGAPEDEIPATMEELSALYGKYEYLFGHSDSVHVSPADGVNARKLMLSVMAKNWRWSHLRAVGPFLVLYGLTGMPTNGALSGKARKKMGMSPFMSGVAAVSSKLFLPIAWLLQRGPVVRHYERLLWGEDAANMFRNARKLHKEALAQR